MYPTVLAAHSTLRWVVVMLGVWAVVSSLPSRQRYGRPPSVLPGLLFSIGLDIQMLLGLVLYVVLSPITTTAMQEMGAVMKNGGLRFWTVEHPAMMILAVVCAHVGRPRGPRANLTGKRALIAYGLALLAILAATPWPFMPQARPWIRW